MAKLIKDGVHSVGPVLVPGVESPRLPAPGLCGVAVVRRPDSPRDSSLLAPRQRHVALATPVWAILLMTALRVCSGGRDVQVLVRERQQCVGVLGRVR